LRQPGDVVWVRIAAPGTTDPDVLAWAAREERILLTLDKDFGELARGSALPRTCGVVLRMPMSRPSDVGALRHPRRGAAKASLWLPTSEHRNRKA
jgi:predicted nuclease of predicted toxin-antitoxin system